MSMNCFRTNRWEQNSRELGKHWTIILIELVMSLSYMICTQEKIKLEPNFTFFLNILRVIYWKKWYSNGKSISFKENIFIAIFFIDYPCLEVHFLSQGLFRASTFWLLGNFNYTWCSYEFYFIFLIKLWHHYLFHRCKRVHMRIEGNTFWINFE